MKRSKDIRRSVTRNVQSGRLNTVGLSVTGGHWRSVVCYQPTVVGGQNPLQATLARGRRDLVSGQGR